MSDEYRDYYYNFGLVIVSIYEASESDLSTYKELIEEYIREYFNDVMKVPFPYKVCVDYFERTAEDSSIVSKSYGSSPDTTYKEFVIKCKLSLSINDNNRLKITNPSKYDYMREYESQFLKKFIHVV